jgi:hypothetical protein
MLARSTNVELKISRPPRFAVVKNEIFSVTELPFINIETLSISNPLRGGPENMDETLEGKVTVPGKVKLIVVVGEVSVNESALAFTAVMNTRHTKKLRARVPRVLMLSSPRPTCTVFVEAIRCPKELLNGAKVRLQRMRPLL